MTTAAIREQHPFEATVHLVQLLPPLYDNAGQRLRKELFDEVRAELVERFGGLTSSTRSC